MLKRDHLKNLLTINDEKDRKCNRKTAGRRARKMRKEKKESEMENGRYKVRERERERYRMKEGERRKERGKRERRKKTEQKGWIKKMKGRVRKKE